MAMKKVKPFWDHLSESERKTSIERIQGFFAHERGEDLGIVAAGEILDFFLSEIAAFSYNKGIQDSKTYLQEGFANLEVNLDSLERT